MLRYIAVVTGIGGGSPRQCGTIHSTGSSVHHQVVLRCCMLRADSCAMFRRRNPRGSRSVSDAVQMHTEMI